MSQPSETLPNQEMYLLDNGCYAPLKKELVLLEQRFLLSEYYDAFHTEADIKAFLVQVSRMEAVISSSKDEADNFLRFVNRNATEFFNEKKKKEEKIVKAESEKNKDPAKAVDNTQRPEPKFDSDHLGSQTAIPPVNDGGAAIPPTGGNGGDGGGNGNGGGSPQDPIPEPEPMRNFQNFSTVKKESEMTNTQKIIVMVMLVVATVAALMYTATTTSKKSVSTPVIPMITEMAPVDPGKVTVTKCVLVGDGKIKTIQSQIALRQAQKDFANKEISSEILAIAQLNAMPVKSGEVIAEVPASKLPKNVSCGDWMKVRAYQLIIGAEKPV